MISVNDILQVVGLSQSELNDVPRDYVNYTIYKRDGSKRVVHEPNPVLRTVQDKLLAFLTALVEKRTLITHEAATGRVGAYENAKRHVGAQRLTKFDIKNFFDAITSHELFRALYGQPYFEEDAAALIARLCCSGSLVQGAPTSSLLADIVCQPLDVALAQIGLTYTRYVDDITFSGRAEPFIGDVERQLARHGFEANVEKTTFCGPGDRFTVTGFVINPTKDKPAVRAPRAAWRRLRAVVNKLEREPDYELYTVASGLCSYVGQTDRERAEPFKARLLDVFLRSFK